MMMPIVAARMEELDDLVRAGVDAGKVRAFMMIAVMASKGEIGGLIASAVLPGNDVFNVKRCEHTVRFGEHAILTSIPRAEPDLYA